MMALFKNKKNLAYIAAALAATVALVAVGFVFLNMDSATAPVSKPSAPVELKYIDTASFDENKDPARLGADFGTDVVQIWNTNQTGNDRVSLGSEGEIKTNKDLSGHLLWGLHLENPIPVGTYYIKFLIKAENLSTATTHEDEGRIAYWDVFGGKNARFGSTVKELDGKWQSVVTMVTVNDVGTDSELRFGMLHTGGNFTLSLGPTIVLSTNAAKLEVHGKAPADKSKEGYKTPSDDIVRVWANFDDPLAKTIADEWNATHPDTKIQFEKHNALSPHELTDAFNNESAPDVVLIDGAYATSMAGQKLITELKVTDEIKAKFADNAIVQVGNHALSFDTNSTALLYNKSKLATPPTDYANTTLPFSGKYSDKRDIQASYITFSFLSYLWRYGGEVLDVEGKASFNSEAGVLALTKIVEMKSKGSFGDSYDEETFFAGKLDMLENGCWQISQFGDKFAVTELPVLKEDVQSYSGLGVSAFAITACSSKTDIATKFVEFVTTSEKYQLEYCKKQSLIPSLKSALSDSFYQSENWQTFIKAASTAKLRPNVMFWEEIEPAIAEAIKNALDGTMSPKNALNQAAEETNKLLRK